MVSTNCKGLVGGIQKFSTEDGPGIRTTVFLKGCPLSCMWCHNPELISPFVQIMRNPDKCIACSQCIENCSTHSIFLKDGMWSYNMATCKRCMECAQHCYAESISQVGHEMTVSEVMEKILQDAGYYEKSGGGITISGGELLLQADFALELAKSCVQKHISVTLDTSGQGSPEALAALACCADYILFDMKCIDPVRHKEYTGADNDLILSNLAMLADNSVDNKKLIMRMPLISGLNDTPEIIGETLEFYLRHNISCVNLLPYHELGVKKAEEIWRTSHVFSPPSHDRLLEICQLFTDHNIKTEILGENL